jgi:membrane associated rhomboid family serine protease
MDPEHSAAPAVEDAEQTCYLHPGTSTRLRCSRCDRPICGRCAIPASVGQHCPECVAEARRSTRRAKPALQAAAPAVFAILAVNIAVYVLQMAQPGMTERFASQPIQIALQGEWWRLLTAMFLHSPSSLLHILFNSVVLYMYGPGAEQGFGTARFVVIYLVSGFLGSATSYLWSEPNISGVGASGAIFGVTGALAVYLRNRRSTNVMADAYFRNLMGFIGLNLVIGFVLPNIDWRAHLGGLAAGAALGLGYDRQGPGRTGIQAATTAAVMGAGLLMVVLRTNELRAALAPFFGG